MLILWDDADAAVLARRGLQLRCDNLALRIARGQCLLHKKRPEPALAEFRAVLKCRHDVAAYHGVVTACLQVRASRIVQSR